MSIVNGTAPDFQARYAPGVVPFTLPQPLVPGDALAIIAPSGPCEPGELWPGLAWVRSRYRVELSPGVLAREGYLAGPDARRQVELARALECTTAKAILATRGGYGAMRALGGRAWEELARQPKWVVGYSDVTALHAMAWRAGVASIHAPNVTGLSRASAADRAAWVACLEGRGVRRVWRGLRVLCPGQARGVLVGGNLSLLHAMAAASLLWIPAGAILAFEEVSEAPYRIDRMLTSLLLSGHLSEVAGVIVGGLERSVPVRDGPAADAVIEERLRSLGIPVLAGAPFGHGSRNEAFVMGSAVEVKADEVRFG
jgi:muramoyltetrapeptide carboxypeptidase